MKRIVEIRAAEGGQDSQLFVRDLAVAVEKLCLRRRWKSHRVAEKPQQIEICVEGSGCAELEKEIGGHRIQRVPPTEKRGRVHTSTVTVAVMEQSEARAGDIRDEDLKIVWFSGTGKGGQHRNKHQNSCRVTHLPTGITESRQSRERDANLRDAVSAIRDRVAAHRAQLSYSLEEKDRRGQVGSGMRGDKTVTIRFQDDSVKNHVTGKSGSAKRYMRGEMDLLW